jgi:hypothetical protein
MISDPKSAKTGKMSGDSDQLLRKICEAIFSRMRPTGGMRTKDGTVKLVPMTDGFVWLRITPAQISKMLSTSWAEIKLAAAVAFCPTDVYAILNARFEGHILVCSSAGSLVVSATKRHGDSEYLFQELTEPFNSMHALQLLDPSESPDYLFIFASVRGDTADLEGWVNGQEASRFAAEGAAGGCGRAPDFHLSADASEPNAGQMTNARGMEASVIDWFYSEL